MCGIIITKDFDKINMIKHRGIETFTLKIGKYNVCHHRLPIQTEVGDVWMQPIQLRCGDKYLLFNGEIFNFDKSKYNSDVEYLFDLFNNSNNFPLEEMNKWDGFWSIVLVKGSEMYCVTDPLGKKQLYYNKEGEICSEIFPLRNNSTLDKLFESGVFKWGYNTNDRTPFNDVKRILPNRLYHFKNGEVKSISSEYFNWETKFNKWDLRELMHKSVMDRLVSKTYEIGCLVSGGLDSSIIAAMLSKGNCNVNYYSVENGEKDYVEELRKNLGIKVNYLNYNIDDDIIESFRFNETPIDLGSVLPQHKLFSVIPEKIVLSGDGADELFGGYRRMAEYDAQYSDIFEELTYYHLPRLDRASMRYTIELRNPFLSHDIVRLALTLPYTDRIDKKFLKYTFKDLVGTEIAYRKKVALKNSQLVTDPITYKHKVFYTFYNIILR